MFPTFTGSSRKSRNVNLSGQKTSNPFTSTSWGPASFSGASKTVAQAQAEREQRQLERDRKQAAIRIQTTWRGYRTRRQVWTLRCQLLDNLYNDPAADPEARSIQAVPVLLFTYQIFKSEDHSRQLAGVARDLLNTNLSAFTSGAIDLSKLYKLAILLLATLHRKPETETQTFLRLLDAIQRTKPQSIHPLLKQYYTVLGEQCHRLGPTSQLLELVQQLVVAPLQDTHGPSLETAYHEFSRSFLTQARLPLLENNVNAFAAGVNLDHLSQSVLSLAREELASQVEPTSQLWVLSHFIALHETDEAQKASQHLYVKALFTLLSSTSNYVRDGFVAPKSSTLDGGRGDEANTSQLDSYVNGKLATLVAKDEISRLLARFTSNQPHNSTSGVEDASFLAGYILTLTHCFPSLGDEIRMRLYLADISIEGEEPRPAIKYFWNAASKTSVFTRIVSSSDAALGMLRQKPSSAMEHAVSGTSTNERQWYQEWRAILLFLELYVFVLRLMDDDDFVSSLNSEAATRSNATSRLRSCGFSKEHVTLLSLFLKHLGFTLYYHANDLLEIPGSADQRNTNNANFLSPLTARRNNSVTKDKTTSFVITAGVDFDNFRSLVTTAMKMIYERDSRRPFLPENHWLMTSKFDMAGFMDAVVREHQRQQELRKEEEAEEDEEKDEIDNAMDVDEPSNRVFTLAGQHRSRQAQLAFLQAQQRKATRERIMAAIGPKLEILRNMPFAIPFETRVSIFRKFIELDKMIRRNGAIDAEDWRLQQSWQTINGENSRERLSRHHASIRRKHVLMDAMNSFWSLDEGLKEPIQITFIDEHGQEEAGIDGGGVTKEFLTSLVTEIASGQDAVDNKGVPLFVTNERNVFYPNPCAVDQWQEVFETELRGKIPPEMWNKALTLLLNKYEFLGRVIGKCMYEGILIDIAFAGFFLLKWAAAATDDKSGSGGGASTGGYRPSINELHELDEGLYRGMVQLKNANPEDVSHMGLDFTIDDQKSLPGEKIKLETRELVPGGSNMTVTNENRLLYISYVAWHRLARQPFRQTQAFLRGLGKIIDPAWLGMFNQNELQRLVGGDSSEIDVEDLRRHTVTSGVYEIGTDGLDHPTVEMFWEVMHSLKDHERRDVLRYVTSTPRAPLLGFSQLKPAFTIRDGGLDQERLPSASTCVNLLKLPQYKSKEVLREKLLYAVQSGAGFGLS